MPSIINSDDGQVSGSAGLKFTSADDGILQIQNNGNTAMTVSDAGVTTFASQPVVPVPAFRGETTAIQNITSGEVAKVDINTVSATNCFDTNGWFDTTNKRYVPQIAGYYQFKGAIYFTGTSQTFQAVYVFKNGSRYGGSTLLRISTSASSIINVVELIYMNGSTDYVELHGALGATSPQFNYTESLASSFEGFLVRAA